MCTVQTLKSDVLLNTCLLYCLHMFLQNNDYYCIHFCEEFGKQETTNVRMYNVYMYNVNTKAKQTTYLLNNIFACNQSRKINYNTMW